MIKVQEALELLGLPVKEKVTGMKGIITSISFDLYGCVQALVNPGMDKDNKLRDTYWFDINRLKIMSKKPAMDVPMFNFNKGPESKPTAFRRT